LYVLIGLLAIRHWRFTDVLAIAMLPYVADRLQGMFPQRSASDPVPALLGMSVVAALVGRGGQLDTASFPAEVLPVVAEQEHLYNDFTLGGFLGYHGVPVFWDSRNDCYPVDVFEDALVLQTGSAPVLPIIERRGVTAVVTQAPHLVEAVQQAGWKQVPTDATVYQVWVAPE